MAKSGEHGGNILQMATRYGYSPSQIIDFSANINPLGMPSKLKSALNENLQLLEQYPDIEYSELYHSLSLHTGLDARYILAGNGATELIFRWMEYYRPQHILIVDPTFAEYRRAASRFNAKVTSYIVRAEDEYKLDDKILTILEEENIDACMLCSPNNPTGLCVDDALLQDIAKVCSRKGIQLFVDESFLDFTQRESALQSRLLALPNVCLLRSLTKFYAIPGLRLGYLITGNSAFCEHMKTSAEPWTINALAALAGQIIFADKAYAQQTYQWLKEQSQWLFNALSKMPTLAVLRPAANFVFFAYRGKLNLQHEMMKQGILIRSCENYVGLNEQHYRVAIRSEGENQRLVEALTEVLINE